MVNRTRSEGGALSVEFLGLVPLLIVIAALALQGLLVVAAGTSTTGAARDGSRAMSVSGQSCAQAVENALPDWLDDGHAHSCSGGDETVSVTVRVPNLLPGISWPNLDVERQATLPDTRP